jgi:hypothetical protein
MAGYHLNWILILNEVIDASKQRKFIQIINEVKGNATKVIS